MRFLEKYIIERHAQGIGGELIMSIVDAWPRGPEFSSCYFYNVTGAMLPGPIAVVCEHRLEKYSYSGTK